MPAVWTEISPDGETRCSIGTPYRFYVRVGNDKKIAMIFQGGGACWSDETCSSESRKFDPIVNESDHPGNMKGLFDFSRENNPIADYTSIFIPYCTADCHLGDAEIRYLTGTDKEVVIRHNGYCNAMSAVKWLFAHIEKPEIIFVTGMSAGAIASPFYAGIIAEKYPQTRVVQIGDSGEGYRYEMVKSVMKDWGATKVASGIDWLTHVDSDSLDFESLYVGAGRFSNITLTQVNYLDDVTQAWFLSLMGAEEPNVNQRLSKNLRELSARIPSFRYYNIPGNYHMVLGKNLFYSTLVNDVSLCDWVCALIEGRSVMNIGPKRDEN